MARWYKLSLPIEGIETETRKAYLLKVAPDYNYLNYSRGLQPDTNGYYFWVAKKLVKNMDKFSITMIYTSGWNWNFAPKKGKKLDFEHSIDCNLKELKKCLVGACRV